MKTIQNQIQELKQEAAKAREEGHMDDYYRLCAQADRFQGASEGYTHTNCGPWKDSSKPTV